MLGPACGTVQSDVGVSQKGPTCLLARLATALRTNQLCRVTPSIMDLDFDCNQIGFSDARAMQALKSLLEVKAKVGASVRTQTITTSVVYEALGGEKRKVIFVCLQSDVSTKHSDLAQFGIRTMIRDSTLGSFSPYTSIRDTVNGQSIKLQARYNSTLSDNALS